MFSRTLGLLVVVALGLGALAGCGETFAAGCTADADCAQSGSGHRCSVSAGKCVECATDGDCASGACLPDGTCAECGPHHGCLIGSVCDSQSGSCRPQCAGGCPGGQVCLPGTDTCVGCVVDSDCGEGEVCGAGNACEPGCDAQHPSCAAGQVCDVDDGRCVACVGDADCASPTPVCDVANHTCVACGADADCPAGEVCHLHACTAGCTASQPCPQGEQCETSSGTCVACVDDTGCTDSVAPRCETSSHTCVACLPGATDNCPAGQYCGAGDLCTRGCKSGADCASGVCTASHDCQDCASDGECAAGNVCQSGTCTGACDQNNPCGGGEGCCASHCLDIQNDPQNCGGCGHVCATGACCAGQCVELDTADHCGACGVRCGPGTDCCGGSCKPLDSLQDCGSCGNACTASQFCDGTACHDPTYPNFCANPNVYELYDNTSSDNAANDVMVSTIVANCPATTAVTHGAMSDPQLVDQGTGEPVAGAGSTFVLAGGPAAASVSVVKWLEQTEQATKVYFRYGVGQYEFDYRDGGTAAAITAPDANHDLFVIELVPNPNGGTLSLIGYGIGGQGTLASAVYFSQIMLPNYDSFTDSWYLVKWTSARNDGGAPAANDIFTIVNQGR